MEIKIRSPVFSFKRCFTCNIKYPLFLFHINTMKYQRPENKGRCFNCRFCEAKKAYKGVYVRNIHGKFKVIYCKTNLWSYLKLWLK